MPVVKRGTWVCGRHLGMFANAGDLPNALGSTWSAPVNTLMGCIAFSYADRRLYLCVSSNDVANGGATWVPVTAPAIPSGPIDIQPMIDGRQSAGGGPVDLPTGIFTLVRPFEIKRLANGVYGAPIDVRGATRNTLSRNAATILRCDGDVMNAWLMDGIARKACGVISNPASSIEGVLFEPITTSKPFTYGVLVRAHHSGCRGVSTRFASAAGIKIAASAADESNANGFFVYDGYLVNGLHGLWVEGPECNGGMIMGVETTMNSGWDFFESGFLGNTFLGNLCSSVLNIGAYRVEGLANYSTLLSDYAEGDRPLYCEGQTALAAGGNVGIRWPDPGQRVSYASRLRFADDVLDEDSVALPAASHHAMATVTHPNELYWRMFERFATQSPSWFINARLFARHGATAEAPLGVTDERNSLGAGNLIFGMPSTNTPFDFVLQQAVNVIANQPLVVTFTSSFLQPSAFAGVLRLAAPVLERSFGAGVVTHDGWERMSDTVVRTTLNSGVNVANLLVSLEGRRKKL